jgi:hypothetical protein
MSVGWGSSIKLGYSIVLVVALAMLQCDQRGRIIKLQSTIKEVPSTRPTARLFPPGDPAPTWRINTENDLMELERCVRLQVSENSLIGKVTDVEHVGNRFFVLDQLQNTVLCFDDEGKFLFQLGKHGQGPGEYETPVNLCVWKGKIVVFTDEKGALIYTLDGVWERTIDFPAAGILIRDCSFLEGDRAYLPNIATMRREVPRHLIMDITKKRPEPLWGFGIRPKWCFDGKGYCSTSVRQESLYNFERVGANLWICPMYSSIIEVFDRDGHALGELKPGFEGLTPDDMLAVKTNEDAHRLRFEKACLLRIIPLDPYVIALYSLENRVWCANIFDFKGHLVVAKMAMKLPLVFAMPTDDLLVIPYPVGELEIKTMAIHFGSDLSFFSEAGIDLNDRDNENPCLLIYRAKPPQTI